MNETLRKFSAKNQLKAIFMKLSTKDQSKTIVLLQLEFYPSGLFTPCLRANIQIKSCERNKIITQVKVIKLSVKVKVLYHCLVIRFIYLYFDPVSHWCPGVAIPCFCLVLTFDSSKVLSVICMLPVMVH